jgi:hypothetical protein
MTLKDQKPRHLGLPKDHTPDGRDRALKRLLDKSDDLSDIERLEYFYLLSPHGSDKYNGSRFYD